MSSFNEVREVGAGMCRRQFPKIWLLKVWSFVVGVFDEPGDTTLIMLVN